MPFTAWTPSWFSFWYDLSMELKGRLNRSLYFETLRRMTPAQRLAKAMELSDLG
jgi:hypothetical protein